MLVFIVGFMGSGKTSAGKRLAKMMNYRFVDMDAMIEARELRSIEEIFEREGEVYFRNLETKVLNELVHLDNTVISCGGGTACFNNNMQLMNERGITVYLKMEPASIEQRLLQSKQKRPLLKNVQDKDLLSAVTQKINEREVFYKQSKVMMNGLDLDLNLLKKSFEYFN